MSGYRDFVEYLARGCVDKRFLIRDSVHAIDVFAEMFKHADSSLRIFAKNLCNDVTDSVDYLISISDFIERGGSVKILLNGYDEKLAINSNLYKRLAYYSSEGYDVYVKQCSVKLHLSSDPNKKEVHFAIADERAYRIENDIQSRTAEVNFNNPALAKVYASTFDKLFESIFLLMNL